MNTSSHSTALVLGGGGSTGNAWLIGVLAGLFESGVDVTKADLTVGTSAGSTAAAQIAGATPTELLADIRSTPPQPRAESGRGPAPVSDHLDRMNRVIAASSDAADLRRRLGAAALELDAGHDDSWQAKWRATVASRFAVHDWPERALFITAIDAENGDPVVFDRHSGIDLVDAVAASCSSGRPYRIGEHRYLDGGFRSNAENADLAAGCDRVLVLSPFGGRSLTPVEWGTHLETQVDALRSAGSAVATIYPDADSEHLFGVNGMNPALRPPAAEAGYRRGLEVSGQLWE